MDEMEEIGQELDRTLRVALTGAGQLAERVSRRTEERLRESRRASTEQAHTIREQVQGEMQAARLIYRPAAEPRWWDSAQPEDVARAWGTAAAWSEHDPQARAAAQLLREGTARKWPGANVEDVFRLPHVNGGSDRPDLRNITEDLANALDDMDQARADRAEAAEREDLAEELRDQADEQLPEAPENVEALTREAQGYEVDAERLQEHATPLDERGVSEYVRTSERELAGVSSAAAKQARMDSAPGFGKPSKDALIAPPKTSAAGRARKAAGQSKTRGQDLGR